MLQGVPQDVKNAGDVVAGSAIAASWLDVIQGGLELAALLLAVLYGAVRLYETDTAKRIIKWVRSYLSQ